MRPILTCTNVRSNNVFRGLPKGKSNITARPIPQLWLFPTVMRSQSHFAQNIVRVVPEVQSPTELLTREDRQELLSRAYVHAVAAGAGFTTLLYDLDRTGIDVQIQAGGTMRSQLALQLKATTVLRRMEDGLHFSFRLRTPHYDWLRGPAQVPRLLVVLDMPEDENQWITLTDSGLLLRRKAYWVDLKNHKEVERDSVTVHIPVENVFDVDAVKKLLERSREGGL